MRRRHNPGANQLDGRRWQLRQHHLGHAHEGRADPGVFVAWRHPDSGVPVHTFAVAARPCPLAQDPTSNLLVPLLPLVGRADGLVDLATSEMFCEQSNMAAIWDSLVATANGKSPSSFDRWMRSHIGVCVDPRKSKPATSPPTKALNACFPVSAL
jgi:hypothetical protein